MKKFLKSIRDLFKPSCCHDFEMTHDFYGSSVYLGEFPMRMCSFKCKECDNISTYHRFAFEEGSGALYYFFDKSWPIRDDLPEPLELKHII